MENMEIYKQVQSVPQTAQRQIQAGRLRGKTDINPMWRIKTLTEIFGAAGFGWYYDIVKQWTENGANGEISAFCNINLYVRYDNEWSKPIQGTGGASFIAAEKNGLYTSDECYKMALTDAISVACKALGVGADIYWSADSEGKYANGYNNAPQQHAQPAQQAANNTRVNGRAAAQNATQRNTAASQTVIETITRLITETNTDTAKFLAFFKVNAVQDLTAEQAKKAYNMLQSKKK